MRSRRLRILSLAAALVVALPAFADPPTTFPARFDCTFVLSDVDRITLTGATTDTRTTRESTESLGSIVFEDADTVRIDSGNPAEPDFVARYRTKRNGEVRYRLTRASRRAAFARIRREGRDRFSGTTALRVGKGRMTFSEDGSTVTGRHTLRLGFVGAYRGVDVALAAGLEHSFTGTLAP